mgnify:CR=1 FL=1
MKITTETTGTGIKVVAEDTATQANAIRTAELTVDGSGLLSYSAFEGKSIGFIKQYFKGEIDGDNIIGRDATTLDSDGVLDLGQYYAGKTVYLTQLGETFYTSDAKEYAEQAEASADNAATSASNAASSASTAAISATNAAASAVDAQTAQSAAETAEANAASSASAASTSETNAANSASAAATSETNAQASANAAASSETAAATSASNASDSADAAATSEANAASSASAASTSETNAAASASAASTSETNAANSASAAATSETNAANSASAASTSETNAANSASAAATSETNAATSASEAEAAKDAVEAITDFTDGNIYRGNGTGISAVNETDFLKSKVPFNSSLVAAGFDIFRSDIWDNVNRPNTIVFSGAGVSDSGHTWQTLAGQSAHVDNNAVRLATNINQYAATAVERTIFGARGSFLAEFTLQSQNNGSGRFWFGKDADNGFHIRLGYFRNQVIARVAGVETVIASENQSLDVSQAVNQSLIPYRVMFIRGGVNNKSFLSISCPLLNLTFTVEANVLDAWESQIFSANTDVKYVGLSVPRNVGLGIYLYNFRLTTI